MIIKRSWIFALASEDDGGFAMSILATDERFFFAKSDRLYIRVPAREPSPLRYGPLRPKTN